ncbi:MaoC family dehydratase [Stutzerimonas nitrititolerans]|uniref:MaoC family dehydratase n=1 Tax=Stutzerimonas nitrititolerans TaxID=2482751 RepID=A0AA42BF66_9GAMM|nr:MaoC family dehydratase [Stutzerimonas nitrititolerans]AFN77089.1 enoyl-CoA hydratase, R-specific [Stutzerimonas stutzeri DSM 10701]KRW73719.1 3-hydroxybutyryl-CoA dehydratase [Pseudomonas sp. TTU2014-066ASC]KRW75189.1 3-hydroxybutyryl-CoA dehydratase [Pseudomonas sp. TTU2014-096BSC]MBA1185307.1 MaoC family dehydratase [Stutzerimonas stutzeri]RRV19717.1 MaoC family dehydratase [Pseudomonas sp. s199]WAD28090.1 MaoC family dehydratase [Pseudomonadaceae bacterium T75]HAQ25616.1 3-hydroxybuty
MTTISNTPYSALEVGQKASFEKTIGERDIQLFAAMSGDRNPVHLDAEFARGTLFKERIAHGMLSGALISAAVACTLPGPGTIYLGQTMRFARPVKIGDTITVHVEILEKLPKNRVRVGTNVSNQNGELVVEGEAEVLAPRRAETVELKELPPISIG